MVGRFGYAFSKLKKTDPFYYHIDWYVLLEGESRGIIDQLQAMTLGYE